ncbi:50S ribosomal protein L10, partial [Chloroflexota bacterium]
QLLSECSIGILTDYRGLSAQEMTGLRRTLRGSGISFKVVKNTLARFAAQRAGREELVALFEGPVAIAFGYGGIVEAPRVVTTYISTSKSNLALKGGFLSDRVLTLEEVRTIATLPTREVLLAKVVGGMQSPIYNLVNHLMAPMQGMVGMLQARIKQLEEE